MYTREKDVFFLNTLKVSLVPNPQEETDHVMFVSQRHTQGTKELQDCVWDHFSLPVIVTTELTFKQGHVLESQKKMFEKDGQNATKITSALADTNILLFRPVTSSFVEILCVRVSCDHFLTVCHRLFSPSMVTKSSSNSGDFSMKTRWNQQDLKHQRMLVLTQPLRE